MQILHNANYNFIRWRWHALALSTLVIVAGLAVIISRGGMPLGIDFSGGTIVIVKFDQSVSEQQVRGAVDPIPGEEVVQQYGEAGDNSWLIRLAQSQAAEQGTNLEAGSQQILDALTKAGLPSYEILSREIVGPVIGADLQRRGIYATLASILAITVYIGFRFRFSFAIGAIAATFHDIIVTLAFLVFFGYDLSLNIVAGLAVIISRGGMPLGIDFSGGTIVIVKFDQPVSEQQVRGAVDPIAGEEVVQRYGEAGDKIGRASCRERV